MIQADVYTQQLSDELTSATSRWILTITLLVAGAIVVLAGIATAAPAVTAVGGFIVFGGGVYTAYLAFNQMLAR